MRKIEINFPIDVEPTNDELHQLAQLVSKICTRLCPPGHAFWPSGYGAKPNWSKRDAAFLGVEASPDAPDSGEPTFDESVYSIECALRPLSENEIAERQAAARARIEGTDELDIPAFLRKQAGA